MTEDRARVGIVVVVLAVIGGLLALGAVGSMFAVRAQQRERSAVELQQAAVSQERSERLRQAAAAADAIVAETRTEPDPRQAGVGAAPPPRGYQVQSDPRRGDVLLVDASGDWLLAGDRPIAVGLGVPPPLARGESAWEVQFGRDTVRLEERVGAAFLILEADPRNERLRLRETPVPEHLDWADLVRDGRAVAEVVAAGDGPDESDAEDG